MVSSQEWRLPVEEEYYQEEVPHWIADRDAVAVRKAGRNLRQGRAL